MDWMDATRIDKFSFEMIDPFDLDESRGYLDNVKSGSATITKGYYTDTRVSAKLTAVNHNYIYGSLIRIHHFVDEYDYHNELGTFFVSSRSGNVNNANEENFTLTSMLDRIAEDSLPWNYSINVNQTSNAVLADLFNKFNVTYRLASGCPNYTYRTAKVFEVGENVLSTIFEIVGDAGARIDVDGHGVVVVSKYIAPSTVEPNFEFNTHNGTITGGITKTNNPFDAVNRVIVEATEDDSKVSGFSDIDNSSSISYNKLGRRKTETYSVDNLSPFTGSQATVKAKSLLSSYEQDPAEYSFNGVYIALETGKTAYISTDDDKEAHKAMLKSCDIPLTQGLVTKYTFKEV